MKKLIIVGIAAVLIGLGGGWLLFRNHTSSTSSGNTSGRKILFYRSPMNPTVTSKVPMKDQMGMDYVPVYADEGSSGGERKIAYYRSPMNPSETSPIPKKDEMGMDYVPVYADQAGSNQIHIDPATQQNIGVTTELVKKMKLSRTIRTTANIAYDETKLYTISTKIMGYVEKLYVDYTGQVVKKGQPLLSIYSPDLVSTQEEYLQAIKYRNQISGSGSSISKQGAEQLVESAKRRLLYWDISEKEIQALEKRGTPEKTMTIYSPANGIVTDKMIINGQNIMPGMALYKIADLTTVWGLAQIYQYELPWIKLGDKVDLQLSYLPGKTFQGRITYIYPFLDTESKTVQVRIEIHNTGNYEFKPGMFADATIKSPLTLETAAVPNQAIIHTGTRDVAIIALGNGYFKPVDVTLGARGDGGYVQILKGLSEGENIVTSSQFLIDSESNLNAALNNMNQPGSSSDQNTGQQNNSSEKPESEKSSSDNEGVKNMQMENNKQMSEGKKEDHSSPVEYKGVIAVKSVDDNKDGKIYQCPMDFNVLSDKPGVDPKCGMNLQEVTIKQAENNLVKHGFKVK
ncbi:MAG: efflux RND transporter periplasmic adaptor subunit [Bacteroidetes bacterium]|nr:efflux RND transporter periplasmic adaptor subunit [Bacteroidota bacterium]